MAVIHLYLLIVPESVKRVIHVKNREDIYRDCDYITIHTPLIEDDNPDSNTKQMINKKLSPR